MENRDEELRWQVAIRQIKAVKDEWIEDLDSELGRLFTEDFLNLFADMAPLSDRDRRAAIYVLMSSIRAKINDLSVACEAIAGRK